MNSTNPSEPIKSLYKKILVFLFFIFAFLFFLPQRQFVLAGCTLVSDNCNRPWGYYCEDSQGSCDDGATTFGCGRHYANCHKHYECTCPGPSCCGGGGDYVPPVCGVEIKPGVTGDNLVKNPSFTRWTRGGELRDWEWGFYPPKKLDGRFWDGYHRPRTSPSVEVHEYIKQDIPVQKGAIYKVRVWAKARHYKQGGEECWGVAGLKVDGSSKVVVTEGKFTWPWKKFETTYVAKDRTMTLELLGDEAGDMCWFADVAFDDISVRKIAGADSTSEKDVSLKIGVWDNKNIAKYRIRNQGKSWASGGGWQETVRGGTKGFGFFNQSFGWTLSNSSGVDVQVQDAWPNNSKICSDTICTSHASYACYDNDVYWYDSCGKREEKRQECGGDYWTNNYRCSGQYRQRQYVHRGCSGSSCYSWSEWINVQNCGGDYWTDEYRCVGTIKQRKIIRQGCSGSSCYRRAEWINVGICCSCDDWLDQSCGQGGCPAREMYQTRTCNPSGCESESQCVSDPQCVGTISGYIWNDANNSDGAGKDPPGEQNYTASAVTVRYSCPSGSGSVDTSDGNYSFSDAPVETCSVSIDTGDLALGWSTTTPASVGVIVPSGGTVTANFGVWDNPKAWFQGCNGGVYGLGVSVSVPYECQGCCDRWFLGADPGTAGGVVISGNATLSCDGRCNERGSSPGWNVENQTIGWSSSLSFSPPPGATTITSKDPVLDPGKSYIWNRSELPAGSNKYQLGSGVAVLYVNGNLTINGKFNSDNPQTQGVVLVVNGNVTINRDNAGDSLADTGSDLDVAIIAKGTISITGNNPQKRLIIKGMLYGKGGISVTGEELEDNRYPRLQTTYNPLYFDPSNPLAKNAIIWREVAP